MASYFYSQVDSISVFPDHEVSKASIVVGCNLTRGDETHQLLVLELNMLNTVQCHVVVTQQAVKTQQSNQTEES